MMSVNDLIEQQDLLKAHQWTFSLWPQQWKRYNLHYLFNWEIHPFNKDQIRCIPREPGIYSFMIQPGVASHPHCSYIMYIGRTCYTLHSRFRRYLREQNDPAGRSKVVRFLNKYRGYIYFSCSIISETEQIEKIENELISAFLPPCNSQFPAEIRPVIGAFR